MSVKAEFINEKTKWQDLTEGLQIHEPATSKLFLTGEWRTETPMWLQEKCRQCLLCVPYCPDSCILVQDGKRQEFDYDHCKGCGICAQACPFQAIEMQQPTE